MGGLQGKVERAGMPARTRIVTAHREEHSLPWESIRLVFPRQQRSSLPEPRSAWPPPSLTQRRGDAHSLDFDRLYG